MIIHIDGKVYTVSPKHPTFISDFDNFGRHLGHITVGK